MIPARIFRTAGIRLAALYAGLFGLSVIVLLAVVYWTTSGALRGQLAEKIRAETTALAEVHRTEGAALAARTIAKRVSSAREPKRFYLLLDPAGRKVAGNLSGAPRIDGWQELALPGENVAGSDADSETGGEHRLLAFGQTLGDGSFLMVAESTYRIIEVEEAIVRAFGWALGFTIVLGIVGGAMLSSGFLRRVDAINRTTRAIIDGRLTDRVPTRGTDDELDRLATNLNEMLDRVQYLMEGLRQVSSDIAHDLRTPLSRLRQQLEDARMTACRKEDYEQAVDRAIADTDDILKIFSALLRIAQVEAGTRRAAFSSVDLSGVFSSIVHTYGAVAEDLGRTLTATIEPGLSVRGDRELLLQMLANLVENALRHTPPGARIEIALRHRAQRVLGFVADDGPGIPPQARDKVFRRFFRLERSRSSVGSGLGLALVAAVAALHGISVTLADNEPGLRVELDFGSSFAA